MKKVLIIEDSPMVRENMAEFLEFKGYHIFVATNGKDGFDMARHNKPHIIVCDVKMPKTDGFEVLDLLKKDSSTSDIPFVFLSALSQKGDLERGLKSAADAYLIKPVSMDSLIEMIESLTA